MADGILGGLADMASESVKATGDAVKDTVKGFGQGAVQQVIGHELSAQEQLEQAQKNAKDKAHVRAQLQQFISPQVASTHKEERPIISKQAIQEGFPNSKKKPMFKDLGSQISVTKGETGRGHKG